LESIFFILTEFKEKEWSHEFAYFNKGLPNCFNQIDLDYSKFLKQRYESAVQKATEISTEFTTISYDKQDTEDTSDLFLESVYHEQFRNLDDEKITRLAKLLEVSEVYVSPGSRAKTFHKESNCRWMRSGRTKSAYRGADLPEVIYVTLVVAIQTYKRAPCQSCFSNWWAGKIPSNQQAHFRKDFEIGQEVKILDGPFTGLPGVIQNLGEDTARVLVSIYGRYTPVEVRLEKLE